MDIRINPVTAETTLQSEEGYPLRSRIEGAVRNPALERGLVEVFAESQTSRTILDVLAARRGPLGFKTLVREARRLDALRGRRGELPLGAIRAVVRILQAANLIRMQRAAFAITPLGRELNRRVRTAEGIASGDEERIVLRRPARRTAARRLPRGDWGEALRRTLRKLKRH